MGLVLIQSAICSSGPANAKPFEITVPAGKKSGIHQIGVYDTSRCVRGPKPKIYKMTAANGTISTTDGTFRIDKGKCKGATLKGTNIYYQPNKGFRGVDKVSTRYSFSAGEDIAFSKASGLTIMVTVK